MDFHRFHGSNVKGLVLAFADEIPPLKNLYSIPAGCYFIDFHGFSKYFMRFYAFSSISLANVKGPVPAFADEMLPLKKPLRDPSWLLFHRFLWISYYFIRYHGFPTISSVQCQQACAGLFGRDAAPKENFTRSQLAAISSIF